MAIPGIPHLVNQILAKLLEQSNMLSDDDGRALGDLLDAAIPRYPNIPRVIFAPVMKVGGCVRVSVEVVIIHPERGIYLTPRDDVYGKRPHVPGNYIGENETILEAADRCAFQELGVHVTKAEQFGPFMHHIDSPRFRDGSILLLCSVDSEPSGGEWYTEYPEVIGTQEKYRPYIESVLRERGR